MSFCFCGYVVSLFLIFVFCLFLLFVFFLVLFLPYQNITKNGGKKNPKTLLFSEILFSTLFMTSISSVFLNEIHVEKKIKTKHSSLRRQKEVQPAKDCLPFPNSPGKLGI